MAGLLSLDLPDAHNNFQRYKPIYNIRSVFIAVPLLGNRLVHQEITMRRHGGK